MTYYSRWARWWQAAHPVGSSRNRQWNTTHHMPSANSRHHGSVKSILASVLGSVLLWVASASATPSPTSLAAAIDTTDASNYTTTSFAISANTLLVFAITGALGAGTGITQPTITCHSLTWVLVDSQTDGASPERALFVFRSMSGSASGSATCSYDFAGQTQLRSSYSVTEWTGVKTSGSNGADAVLTSNTTKGNDGTTPTTITWSNAFGTGNRPMYITRTGSATDNTAEAGWTELSDPAGAESMTHSTGWRDATDDTSVDITRGAGNGIYIGIEIVNAATNKAHPLAGNDSLLNPLVNGGLVN